MPNTTLLVASSDEHFREMVRDNLINLPDAKIVAEYQEVAANLYIRVLQDLERHPARRPDRRYLGRSRGRHQGDREGEAGGAGPVRDGVATFTPMARP